MITVLMGAPGAGKTTWVRNNAQNEVILSSEAVRIYKTDLDIGSFMDGLRVKGFKAVKEGKSIIVDATNTIQAHRLYWLKVSKLTRMPNRLIVFNTPLTHLLQAQTIREFPAADTIVKEHYRRLNRSLNTIKIEGWDEIEIIDRLSNRCSIVKKRDLNRTFNETT